MVAEIKKEKSLPVWLCVILFIVGFITVSGVLTLFVGIFIGSDHLKIFGQTTMLQDILNEVCMFIGALCVSALLLRFCENKRMDSLGMGISGRLGDIFTGLIVAAFIMGGGFYFLLKLGDIRIAKFHFNENLFLWNIVLFIIVSVTEEISFRGYILGRMLRSNMNKFLALLISAVIFMLFHLGNEHTSMLSLLNVFWAGVLLGSTYIYTKNLWYPISLHFFWNFLQGPVLGFSVSGMSTKSSLIHIKHSSNMLLNGGNFGFEGSLLCTLLIVLFIVLTIWIMENKEQNKQLHQRTQDAELLQDKVKGEE